MTNPSQNNIMHSDSYQQIKKYHIIDRKYIDLIYYKPKADDLGGWDH